MINTYYRLSDSELPVCQSPELTGTMWYVEVEAIPGSGVYQPTLTLSDVEISVPEIRNVRKFGTDISGVSFRAGIRIRF